MKFQLWFLECYGLFFILMYSFKQGVEPFKTLFRFRFGFGKFNFVQVQQILFLKVQFWFRFSKFYFKGSV